VSWNGGAARVAPSGAVLDPDGVSLPEPVDPVATALAFDGESYLAISDDRGTRITTGGVVLDPAGVDLVVGANRQSDIDSASDGTTTFVVWSDNRRDAPGIYGARVGPDGQALDGTGIRLSDGDNAAKASVGFDGSTYLVAWTEVRPDAQYVRAARVSPAGDVLGRFDISRGESPGAELSIPAVASGDGLHLVAWHVFTPGAPGEQVSEIRATRVGSNGTVLDPAAILVAEGVREDFDVVRGASDFLVVWTGDQDYWDVLGTFVTAAGTVPNPAFPVSDTWEETLDPQVAWNGTTYLVVWTTRGNEFAVSGARVDGAGTVLDPAIPISRGPGVEWSPTVAANGSFFVTWIDRRRISYWARDQLVATRVDPDGTVAHPGGYPVLVEDEVHELGEPVLVPAATEGDFTLSYTRFVAEQPFGSDRAFIRTISPK
jgi:hypothetical protein